MMVSLDITATTYPNLTGAPASTHRAGPERHHVRPGVYYLGATIGTLANADVLVITAQLPN